MVDPNQEELIDLDIDQLLDAPAPALVLSAAADDARPSFPPQISPMEEDAIAAEYLLPRPSGSPGNFSAPFVDIEALLPNPPAPPVPGIFPPTYTHNSGIGPLRASSAAQSPAGVAVAVPPAPPAPSVPLSQVAPDLALHHVFPDPSAAIAASAHLPTKSADPHVVTLTSGLVASAAPSNFLVSIPEAYAFAVRVCQVSQFVSPEKLVTFLDGGDGRTGILVPFRRKRAEMLHALRPGRSGSSVSGSAYEDARYFERQILIPLTDNALRDVARMNGDAITPYLPERQQQDIRYCGEIMDAGGGRELMRRNEKKMEDAGAKVHAYKLAAKEEELLAGNNGLPLSSQQKKKVRDAASGARSNEMRKQLYDLTRAEVMKVLVKRWELACALAINTWPDFSSRREVTLPRPR